MQQVLVIDDNEEIGKALRLLFSLHGIETLYAPDPDAGVALIQRQQPDLVIQDMNFSLDTTSGREGVALFHRIRKIDPDLPVILFTAWADLETAVELVRAGAADYVTKPWDDHKLVTSAKNLLELRELQRHNRHLKSSQRADRQRLEQDYNLCGAVFESQAMQQVIGLATRVAPSDVPVLITGPNGSGKDVLARIIQANSRRFDAPFITVNVGALPEELMEAELFGAEAGAYTGANKAREGRFEAADGGTLFLDEIGNLSPVGQMKLLRILQTGEYERLGSSKTRRVDVRIITATNTDLREAIRQGGFREDLYYRINVIECPLPPLKGRREDILPLAEHFLPAEVRLTDAARQALLAHNWPGNVRELQNMTRRAALLAQQGEVSPQDLGLDAAAAQTRTAADGAISLDDDDPVVLASALEKAGGNVSRAARALGLSRQALYRRMEKHGLGED